MGKFDPRDVNFEARVRSSFENQPFINHLGGTLLLIAPGAVDIRLPFRPEHAQQHGYAHGGLVTTIADAAAGYAAMTLMPAGVGVLTTELKVNFLRPAGEGALVANGRVIKPGRTLNICQTDVYEDTGDEPVHVLTGLVTMMSIVGQEL